MTEINVSDGLSGDGQSWQRSLSGSPLLDALAAAVDGWEQLQAAEADWLTHTELPAGWELIPVAEDSPTPLRVATIALDGHPGWVACQALSAFRFTGAPTPELLRDNAEHSLRQWRAKGINTARLVMPDWPGVVGVRSDGSVMTTEGRLWVRYSTYLRGSTEPGQGLVVQEVLIADGEAFRPPGPVFDRLGKDFGVLTGATEAAFLTRIGATDADIQAAVDAHAEQLRLQAARRPALTEEQCRFLSTALAMWAGVAAWRPLPITALGYASWPEFDADIAGLRAQLDQPEPRFSDADWTRILLLAEISFASDLLGAGSEFEVGSAWRDPKALRVLRSIQRELGPVVDAQLLFPGAGRPHTALGDVKND